MLSVPYMSEESPSRWGRDFRDENVGSGRIEEAAPDNMSPDSNAVGKVVVKFNERDDLPTVDTRDIHGAPSDYWTFRRQIINEAVVAEAIGLCIEAALTAPENAL